MFEEYTVQRGDTLSKIAEDFFGDSGFSKHLAKFNSIDKPNLLEVGQKLEIPNGFYHIERVEVEKDVPVVKVKTKPSIIVSGLQVWADKDGTPRRAAPGQVLGIVPLFRDRRRVSCKFGAAGNINWQSSGCHIDEKSGNSVYFDYPAWGIEHSGLWLGKMKPRAATIRMVDENGKTKTAKLDVYPGNRINHEIAFSKSPFCDGLRQVFTHLGKLLEDLTGRELEVSFLVGKLAYKSGFEEDVGSHHVYYGYELSGSLNPVFSVKYSHPFGLNAIVPAALEKFRDALKFSLFVEGAFNLSLRYYRDSINNKGGDLKSEFKLTFGVEGSAEIKLPKLFGRGERKVIDAKLGGASGVGTVLGPVVEEVGLGVRANVSWDGIKISGSIVAFDGLYTYKKEIVLIQEQKLLQDEVFYFVRND